MGDRIPTFLVRSRKELEADDSSGVATEFHVVIPDGVTWIRHSAFRDCSRLTSVTIAQSVSMIGYNAFRNCTGLTSMTIPEGVTDIFGYAFKGCSGLTSVTIPKGVIIIENEAFKDCTELTSMTIPESITTIGDYAFMNCSGLTSLTIPEGVATIGAEAFRGCSGLISVITPRGVKIGENSFQGCHRLSFVIAPAHLRESLRNYFVGCPLLTQLEADTEKNRRQALRLQFWSASTHMLCTEPQREWVALMMVVLQRLRSQDGEDPVLPIEMWLMILGFIPRWALGPHV